MKFATRFLQTLDGFELAVPPRIKDPYFRAIMESDTWYEPETAFLRRLARPGLRVLDIDAGIGFHSLLFAKLCGSNATIFSIFPDPIAEYCLLGRASIEKNKLDQIKIINVDTKSEIYPGYRFDQLNCFQAEAFKKLDLVRIGLPTSRKITANSELFLQNQSPLLMLEIGSHDDAAAFSAFLQPLGYQLLHYVPGLQALKPATLAELNLQTSHVFFCKRDCLAGLMVRELAFIPAESVSHPAASPELFLNDFRKFVANTGIKSFQDLAAQPVSDETLPYFTACAAYLMGRDFPLSLTDRFAYLLDAQTYFLQLQDALALPQRLNLFLIELALGRRDQAIKILENTHFNSGDDLRAEVNLPFLVDPVVAQTIRTSGVEGWLQSYLIESYETCRRVPAFYSDNSARTTLLIEKDLQRFIPVAHLAREKRRIIAATYLGLPYAPFAANLLEEEWLNAASWRDLIADNGEIYYFHSVFERDVDDNINNYSNPLAHCIALCANKGLRFKTYLDIGSAEATAAIVHYRTGLFRDMKIVNVEPNDVYNDSLAKISAATGGIHIPCAVSDYDGEAQFQESGHEYWSSLRPADDLYWNDYRDVEIKTRPVPVHTIATLMEKYALEGPVFLKMDVQGSEESVLRGMEAVADQVAFVIVETIAIDLAKINGVLDRLGFSLFNITGVQYYKSGIIGWFYPYYINKKYLPLFHSTSEDTVDASLIQLQVERRENNRAWLEDELALLSQEKIISAI